MCYSVKDLFIYNKKYFKPEIIDNIVDFATFELGMNLSLSEQLSLMRFYEKYEDTDNKVFYIPPRYSKHTIDNFYSFSFIIKLYENYKENNN